jgi:hypothetical protein
MLEYAESIREAGGMKPGPNDVKLAILVTGRDTIQRGRKRNRRMS